MGFRGSFIGNYVPETVMKVIPSFWERKSQQKPNFNSVTLYYLQGATFFKTMPKYLQQSTYSMCTIEI